LTTADVVFLLVFLVIAAAVVNSAARAQRALRSFAEDEGDWHRHGFPAEIRRTYPQLRVEIVDRSRMRLLGYDQAEREVHRGPGLSRQALVLWRAARPPARAEPVVH